MQAIAHALGAMPGWEYALGTAMMLAAIFAITGTYIRHMQVILNDCEDERVEERAEELAAEWLENADVRVRQEMYIVCGQGFTDKGGRA